MTGNRRLVRRTYHIAVAILAGVLLLRVSWMFAGPSSGDLRITDSRPLNHGVGGQLPNVFIASYSKDKADSLRLSELVPEGRCAVIIFYSATCGPCHLAAAAWRAEAAQPEVGDLLWISIDQDPASSAPFAEKYSIAEPRLVLRGPNDADTLGVIYTPTVYVVNDSLAVLRRPGPGPEDIVRRPSEAAATDGYKVCDPGWTKKESER